MWVRSGDSWTFYDQEEGPWVFEKPYPASLHPVDLDKYEIPEYLIVPIPKNSRGDNSQKGSTDE